LFGSIGTVLLAVGLLLLFWSLGLFARSVSALLTMFTRAPPLTFAVLWLSITFPILIGGIYSFASQHSIHFKLNTEAHKTIGTVLTKQIVRTHGHGRDSGTTNIYYRLSFRFDAPADEVVGVADLDGEVWARLFERGPIAVSYLADEPWHFRTAGADTDLSSPIVLLAFGSAGTLIGIGVLILWLKGPRSRKPVRARAVSSTPRVSAAGALRQRPASTTGEDIGSRATIAALTTIRGFSTGGGVQQRWRWTLGAWALPLVGIIPAVVGLLFVFFGVKQLIDERAYTAHGMVAQGSIIGKSLERAGESGSDSTKYRLAYRFTTARGETIDGGRVVPPEAWEETKEGDPISVRYLPDRPQANREAAESKESDAIFMTAMGLLFTIIGGSIVTAVGARDLHRWHLRHRGVKAEGTVLEIEPSWLTLNGVPQKELHYSFNDAAGQRQEGRSGPVAPDMASKLRVGSKGIVFYDLNSPDDNMWAD
jgi:hypothetical protein